jgi:hypothetical protein
MYCKLMAGLLVLVAALALAAPPAPASDVTVTVQQDVLQNFISTVGTVGITGGDSTTIQIPVPGLCNVWDWIYLPCIQWTSCTAGYSWGISASNISAQIIPGSIPFSGNAHAQASAGLCGINVSASYSPAFNGDLDATWLPGPQQISFSLQTLNIEIYVSILGYHITLGFVDVAHYLPNPLVSVPVPLSQGFNLPPPISKHITVTAQNTTLALMSGFLQLTANLKFTSP